MKRSLKKTALGLSVAVAAACLMTAPVGAVITGSSGAGITPASNAHTDYDNMLHLADGTHLPKSAISKEEHKFLQEWERSLHRNDLLTLPENLKIGVLNIAVGETVVLHARQENMMIDPPYVGARGLAQNRPGSTVHADVYTTRGIALADVGVNDLAQSNATGGINAGDYTVYCLEWNVVGQYEGVDYLWYQDGPVDGKYIKIVVGGGKSSSSGSSSSSSKSSSGSSSPSGSSSSSSSNSTSGGSASSSSASSATTTASGSAYTVQAGDTLANIALNYYGNHQLWPYLQQANQAGLNQTADGLIYAGFELHLPDTLQGVARMSPPAASGGEVLYTVQYGDTLGSIAQAHFGDISRYTEIFNRNSDRLKDVHTLMAGQVIVLP